MIRIAKKYTVVLAVATFAMYIGGCQSGEPANSGPGVYNRYCITCHQTDGKGIPGAFPPIYESEWANGDPGRFIRLVLSGMQGPITVAGQVYNNVMTPHAFLSDEQIAAVMTYVRQSFGNDAPEILPADVAAVRASNEHVGFWIADDLRYVTGIPETDSTAATER